MHMHLVSVSCDAPFLLHKLQAYSKPHILVSGIGYTHSLVEC